MMMTSPKIYSYRVSRNRTGLLKTSVASVAPPRVDEKVFFFTRVMTVL